MALNPEDGVMRSYLSDEEAELYLAAREAKEPKDIFDFCASEYVGQGRYELNTSLGNITTDRFADLYKDIMSEEPLPKDDVAEAIAVHDTVAEVMDALTADFGRRSVLQDFVAICQDKILEAWDEAS